MSYLDVEVPIETVPLYDHPRAGHSITFVLPGKLLETPTTDPEPLRHRDDHTTRCARHLPFDS